MNRSCISSGLVWLVCSLVGLAASAAQAAPFTYQGRLDQNGAPKSGTVDLRFDVFAGGAGGAALNAAPVIRDGVPLVAGVFTVEVDFGAAIFTGGPAFVQIGVREDALGDASTLTGFTDLSPRQVVTATPYAQHAINVGSDAVGSVQIANGSIMASDANTTSSSDGLQRRVSGNCAANNAIRAVNADGTVECEANDAGASGWGLTGNTGTDPATQFIGTTDAQPLLLRVDNTVAGRIQRVFGPVPANEFGTNLVWGDPANSVEPDVVGATIAGGGGSQAESPAVLFNRVDGNFGTVGGGLGNGVASRATVAGGLGNIASNESAVGGGVQNSASGETSTVAGGSGNTASGDVSSIGGGTGNAAQGQAAFVGGGANNVATGESAAIGGGLQNHAVGFASMVPGGEFATAGGDHSFAAGRNAKVRSSDPIAAGGTGEPATCSDAATCGDEGTFLWADSRAREFHSQGPNQFLIRAAGGVGLEPGSGDQNSPSVELANVPEGLLHVFDGSAGEINAAATDPIAVFESSDSTFITLLAPDARDRGIRFGNVTGGSDDGAINYNDARSMHFITGGAVSMVLSLEGNLGLGIDNPAPNRLYVRAADSGSLPGAHVVQFENSNEVSPKGVLALKHNVSTPDAGNGFVRFFNAANAQVGSITGNGAGGVLYNTTGADYAEWLPRLDASEFIAPGDLVGLHAGGRVGKRLDGAIRVLIASTDAAVAGNAPGESPEATHTLTAFVGQVRARVCGPVRAGEVIVAGDQGSGCGVARDPTRLAAHEVTRVAGTAWEDADGDGEHRVRVAVGLDAGGAERAQWMTRIDALERKLADQQALVEALLAREAGAQGVATSAQ